MLSPRGASLEDKLGRRRAGFEFADLAHDPWAAVEANEAFGIHGEGKQRRPRTLRVRDHRVHERDPLRQAADVQLTQTLAVKDENGDRHVVPTRHLGEESAVVRGQRLVPIVKVHDRADARADSGGVGAMRVESAHDESRGRAVAEDMGDEDERLFGGCDGDHAPIRPLAARARSPTCTACEGIGRERALWTGSPAEAR